MGSASLRESDPLNVEYNKRTTKDLYYTVVFFAVLYIRFRGNKFAICFASKFLVAAKLGDQSIVPRSAKWRDGQ